MQERPDEKLLTLLRLGLAFYVVMGVATLGAGAAPLPVAEHYRKAVEPILSQYCYECHSDGVDKGGVVFDEMKSDEEIGGRPQLWLKVLKNTRSGLMPPPKKEQPTAAERETLERWIKYEAFGLDPKLPDPGRVTVRRMNRVEYRNTIRDLMDFDFKVDEEFPPDDTGYGFDNIGDVLTVSPMLLEKYMQAAERIVNAAVPSVAKVMLERNYVGGDFHGEGGGTGERMSFYKEGSVGHSLKVEQGGSYRLTVDLAVLSEFDFDPGRCKVTLRVDGEERETHECAWGEGSKVHLKSEEKWTAGEHRIEIGVEPLVPVEQKKNSLNLRIAAVKLAGPVEEDQWVAPKNYDRYFTKAEAPKGEAERREYARDVLGRFATKAFRRPVDARTLKRLATVAEAIYTQPGRHFEDGIREAMVATLSSPRFLFRVEGLEKEDAGLPSSRVDEYALASRLSYFLWSTMPDETLIGLAERGELRKNLKAQVERMLKDSRSESLVQNFVGQWMQTRDVETVSINTRAVLGRDGISRQERQQLDKDISSIRRAMHRETEMYFGYVMREDKSVLDFLDSDYTFLNDKLAKHYGVDGVQGSDMRRVELPKGSARGGLLTQGTVLLVTSNPTRTSPVKRGLFVLDNILGSPPPPPPPDIPQLEESFKQVGGRDPTLREMLQVHRDKPLCSACHARMDPLGLAMENFNALGGWRETENQQPIDAAGKLLSGETFKDIRELKQILKSRHRMDFYRCLTEKLMTYALGRGMEYYDTEAIDQIVAGLDKSDGRFSVLLSGIIDSSPFQRRRNGNTADLVEKKSGTRADIGSKP